MTDIVQTAGPAPTPSKSAQAAAQLSTDYQSFLKLLTAQISNQDPLEPMDSTAFVSQLAQLSQVEQSIQTNTNLEAISAAMAANFAKIDLGLLGHDVLVRADRLTLGPEGATLGYRLSKDAAQVAITIRDESGALVRQLSGPERSGGTRHEMVWDGLSTAGTALPEGTYTMSVSAVTPSGDPVSVRSYALTPVEGVVLGPEGATLKLANGQTGTPEDVLEVR